MPNKPYQLKQAPRKILVVPLRYIGDTILSVPLIRNLRQTFADSQLDVMVSPSAFTLLEPCPYISELHREPKGAFNVVDFLKLHDYDLVVILRKSASMALYCKLAGIPVIIGYDKQRFPWGYKRWGLALNGMAEYPGLKTETPQALSHLKLIEVIGQTIQDQYLELWTTPADEQTVDNLLNHYGLDTADKALAVVHTASASHGKSIEPARFIPAIEALIQRNYQVLFTGIDVDKAQYDAIIAQTPSLTPCLNIAGMTTLRQTVALYKRVQVLLTVDSSPVHMGLATGIPNIIGVYGPTNHRQWGAYKGVRPTGPTVRFIPVYQDLDCRPCYAKICEHNNCRVQLSADSIKMALQQIF